MYKEEGKCSHYLCRYMHKLQRQRGREREIDRRPTLSLSPSLGFSIFIVCQCLSVFSNDGQCLAESVSLSQCLSVSVVVCHCLTLTVIVCHCPSALVCICQYMFISFVGLQLLPASIFVRLYLAVYVCVCLLVFLLCVSLCVTVHRCEFQLFKSHAAQVMFMELHDFCRCGIGHEAPTGTLGNSVA